MEHQASLPLQPAAVPYDTRAHRGRPQQHRSPSGGERDTLTEFQEQFNKIAESMYLHYTYTDINPTLS